MAARVEAGQLGSDSLDSEHLLMGIVCVHPDLFTSLGIEIELDSLREKCREFSPAVQLDRARYPSPTLQRFWSMRI